MSYAPFNKLIKMLHCIQKKLSINNWYMGPTIPIEKVESTVYIVLLKYVVVNNILCNNHSRFVIPLKLPCHWWQELYNDVLGLKRAFETIYSILLPNEFNNQMIRRNLICEFTKLLRENLMELRMLSWIKFL